MIALEAAGYDPLRARELYDDIDRVWWERYLLDREWRMKAQERAQKPKKQR